MNPFHFPKFIWHHKVLDALNYSSKSVCLFEVVPEPPRVPNLLLGDETPENASRGLAKKWPSAGVVSAEAGIVLGRMAWARIA